MAETFVDANSPSYHLICRGPKLRIIVPFASRTAAARLTKAGPAQAVKVHCRSRSPSQSSESLARVPALLKFASFATVTHFVNSQLPGTERRPVSESRIAMDQGFLVLHENLSLESGGCHFLINQDL